jgi:hypothetical protein
LPLPSDIEFLSFLLCFIARLLLVPLSDEPVVKTSPDDTAPLGLLGAGAVPLGTALGLAGLGRRGLGQGGAGAAQGGSYEKMSEFHRRKKRKRKSFETCTPKIDLGL